MSYLSSNQPCHSSLNSLVSKVLLLIEILLTGFKLCMKITRDQQFLEKLKPVCLAPHRSYLHVFQFKWLVSEYCGLTKSTVLKCLQVDIEQYVLYKTV